MYIGIQATVERDSLCDGLSRGTEMFDVQTGHGHAEIYVTHTHIYCLNSFTETI